MNQIESDFLVRKLQYQEMLREAEQQRLTKTSHGNEHGRQSSSHKMISWIRAKIPGNNICFQNPSVKYDSSTPCI